MKITRFVEKPSKEEALRLIEAGASWNCGVVALRFSYLSQVLKREGFSLTYETVCRRFSELEPVSMDYKLLESAEHMIMIPYEGEWLDIGDWPALTAIWKSGCSADQTAATVINETGRHVRIVGLKDILVVATQEGILIRTRQ